MTSREVLRVIRRMGGEQVRQSGSHVIVRVGDCQTVVPVHSGDIPDGTLRSIERDLAPCLGPGWLR